MSGVLCTGAGTPVGDAVARALAEQPDIEHVLALGGQAPLHPKIHGVQADWTRTRAVHDVLFGPVCELGIDAVVHGPLHRRATDGGPRHHALDVESTRELLRLAERHPTLRRLIYLSPACVYRQRPGFPETIQEDHPLQLGVSQPWLRDRVEGDLTVCARMGMGRLKITVLRLAEVLARGSGSQLEDFLSSRVCVRALGYDPMINLIAPGDVARAVVAALAADRPGVYNIAGKTTLPLSALIEAAGRIGLALPGPLLGPLYRLRARLFGRSFVYSLNRDRFHFSGVLDGARAARDLGYSPREAAL
jgi:UDP-glucose 4-epimerase